MKKLLLHTLAALFALSLAAGCSDGLVSGYDIPDKQTKPKDKQEEKEDGGQQTNQENKQE